MGSLKIELPPDVHDEEAKLLLMIKLYETGKLSLGQAAKYAGYSKRAFIEILSKHEVAVFDHSPDDLDKEIEL